MGGGAEQMAKVDGGDRRCTKMQGVVVVLETFMGEVITSAWRFENEDKPRSIFIVR
jgi:hypothetical protein